jgi:tetratricopeptide (TPR) repeat protein
VLRTICLGVIVSSFFGASVQNFVLADELSAEQQKLVDDLTKQIQSNPSDFRTWAARAVVYRNAHDHVKAEPDIEKALKLNPKWQQGYMFKAVYLDDRGRRQEAIDAVNTAETLGPLKARDYAWRGALLGLLKNYEPSLKDLNRAIEMDPTDGQQFGARAFAKLQLYGPSPDVVRDLEQALKLDPTNEHDRALLKDVRKKLESQNVQK